MQWLRLRFAAANGILGSAGGGVKAHPVILVILRKWSVDIELVGGGNKDFSAGNCRDGKLQSETSRVARAGLRTIIQLASDVGCVVGVQHRWPAFRGIVLIVVRVVDIPDNAV